MFAYLPSDVLKSYPYLMKYPKDSKSTVLSISYYNNSMTVKVMQEKRAFLTFNEYYSPHWKATIDGKPTKIIKTNVNQMGVISPAGEHSIVITYNPSLFIIFRYIQQLCFLIIIGILLFLSYTLRKNGKLKIT